MGLTAWETAVTLSSAATEPKDSVVAKLSGSGGGGGCFGTLAKSKVEHTALTILSLMLVLFAGDSLSSVGCIV